MTNVQLKQGGTSGSSLQMQRAQIEFIKKMLGLLEKGFNVGRNLFRKQIRDCGVEDS